MTFANVAHREKVPLRVVERVVVKIEEQVILAIFDSLNLPQVARLELRIEKERFVGDFSNVDRLRWRHQTFRGKVGVHATSQHRILNKLFNM